MTAASGSKLRNQADLARDRKDWIHAAKAYQQYLEMEPDHWEIWVQLGHAVKEQGNLIEAEVAYRKAATLAPMDADCRVHLGHVLKRLGRPQQAAAILLQAVEIVPTPEVVDELKALGHIARTARLLDNVTITTTGPGRYLELKDLFQYLSHHTTATGITRVVLGLVQYLLEKLDDADAECYHFVHQLGDAEALTLIPKAKLRHFVRVVTADAVDIVVVLELIEDIKRTSPLVQLRAGDLYFIPGAFWNSLSTPNRILSLKRRGVYIGIYIYDLIPISHRHYCTPELSDEFNTAFAEIVRTCDFALTISEFVAGQVLKFLRRYDIKPFPVVPVPLAHEHLLAKSRPSVVPSSGSAIEILDARPFVLCVCTIEARKNHIYLFYIWQKMIDAGIDVPDLVFVGRHGWRINDLVGQIEASRNLDGRLHIFHGLADADLTTLYERCLFTAFPSFVEGWGLPVGESLSYSKVCVASSTTSIPEVGGDLVVYVDPFNLASGYQAIVDLITTPGRLADLEKRISKNFVRRSWGDVGGDFCSGLDGALSARSASATTEVYTPRLRAGSLLEMNELYNVGKRRPEYSANPIRLAFARGWKSIEATGTWILGDSAEVRFSTDYHGEREILILLLVGISPWVDSRNQLRVWNSETIKQSNNDRNGSQLVRPIEPNSMFWLRLKGKVDVANSVTIQFRVDGPIEPADPTASPVGVRLHAIGYSAADDHVSRISLMEEALLLRGS